MLVSPLNQPCFPLAARKAPGSELAAFRLIRPLRPSARRPHPSVPPAPPGMLFPGSPPCSSSAAPRVPTSCTREAAGQRPPRPPQPRARLAAAGLERRPGARPSPWQRSRAPPEREEGAGRGGRGGATRARKCPPPACWAAATAAARKDLKPFGGGVGGSESLHRGAPGPRSPHFPSPCSRVPGWTSVGGWGAVARPVRAGAGRGVPPQAPGGLSRPEGRARSGAWAWEPEASRAG